jgi:predicted RNA polymerase sigma factor
MARSSTEWARKMPMLVGIIYGLSFQAMALSRMGRHDEAMKASDEAIAMLDGARTDGLEHIFRWRAEVLTSAGRHDDAKAALARAAAEVDTKAQKLRDPELRKHYLASRQRTV